MSDKKIESCINCSRTEEVIPLISFKYSGGAGWICSQCLPTMIHETQKLNDKLVSINQTDTSDTK